LRAASEEADEGLEGCMRRGLERLEAAHRLSLPRGRRGNAWETFEWQRLKRLIARTAATCLCRYTGCPVYLGDIHGGEPSEGLGGKDADLILGCPMGAEETRRIEQQLERVTAAWLHGVLGDDPYRFLGVANIVELHTVAEYLFKKYVEAGPPYVVRIC